MDDLVVNSKLTTLIVDDEDADAATAIIEGIGQTMEETTLIDDGETLLDIASLGHGDNPAILTDVKDTVLLEHRAEHVLDDDRWRRVGDEARLLMELLGEQVNTKVTVLTSLRRSGDADDLARATLKDQEIANADVVAGDGDSVGRHGAGFDGLNRCRGGNTGNRRSDVGLLDDDFLAIY